MKKNLKKVVQAIYKNAKEKDEAMRTFDPRKYPVNWSNAIKYVKAKDKSLTFNTVFKPIFAEIFRADVKAYLAGGHKLTTGLKKAMKENAKQKAKEIAQAQIEVKAAFKQSGEGQEQVLSQT